MDSSTVYTTSLAPYAYPPLKDGHFRFIELLPGVEGDPIRIKIFHSPIYTNRVDSTLGIGVSALRAASPKNRSVPTFEALSYAWGTDTVCSPILVDEQPGTPTSSPPIRSNLMVALTHLRTSFLRTLWIDAICINQADDEEKATQVTKMDDIFSLAYRVVIWLGPKEADSDIALAALKEFVENTPGFAPMMLISPPDAPNLNWWKPEYAWEFGLKNEEAVKILVRRPWFSRLWVVQEAQLASALSIIQCGHRHMPLPRFLESMQWLSRISSFSGYRNAYFICVKLEKTIRFVLGHITNLKCSDPRDKIYGLLTLLPKPLAREIRPDYGISARELYKKVVLVHTNQTRRLDLWFDHLLSGAEEWDTSSGLPSWVPDWSLMGQYIYWSGPQFSSGRSRAHFTDEQPNVLTVTGIICGTVATISKLGPGYDDLTSEVGAQWLEEFKPPPEGFDNGIYRPTGEPVGVAHIANISGFDYMERYSYGLSSFPTIEEMGASIHISTNPRTSSSRIDLNANFGWLVPVYS